MENPAERLKIVCEKIFSPLITPYGFSGPLMEGDMLWANAYYVGKKTAVEICADVRDQTIDAAIVLLVDGKVPENRVVKGKKVFAYAATILSRMPERTVSFEQALENFKKKIPPTPPEDWMEEGAKHEAYLFSEFGNFLLTDKDDVLEDRVKKGGFKF